MNIQRRRRCLAYAVVFAMGLALPGESKLNVVATTADFGSLARDIGGEDVEVLILTRPTEDSHFVDPKPSFVAKLSRADVLVEGGADLEVGWLPPLLDGARNSRLAVGEPGRIACAEGMAMLGVPAVLDRSSGDLHALGNPHFMVDPVRARQAARRICEGFSAVDPVHAAAYGKRCDDLVRQLDAKLAEWLQRLAPFKDERVAAYHDTWPYFAGRFGIKIDMFLEPKPGIPPTPAHLAKVIAQIQSEGVGVILIEPHQNRRTAETVAAKTGATILNITQFPGGRKGTEGGYVAMMDYLVNSLASALEAQGKRQGLQP